MLSPGKMLSLVDLLVAVAEFLMGGTVAQWLALLPHSTRDPGFDSRPQVTVCVKFAHSPRVCVCFLRVLPQSNDVRVRLIGQAINCPLES